MLIYYVSNSTIPSESANSIHVMKMCQAFAKNGHKTILFAGSGGNEKIDDFEYYGVENNFEIVKLEKKNSKIGRFLYCLNVKKKIKEIGEPDIIYSRDPYCLSLMKDLKIPYIYEAHNKPNRPLRYIIEHTLLKGKQLLNLVTISQALKNEYISVFPWLNKDKKVLVAHDGADIVQISRNNKNSIFELRGREGLLDVGYIGHLYPGKGMEVIVQLAPRLHQFDFHIVGGTKKDVEKWQKKCQGVHNIYFYGHIPHGRILGVILKLDVLLAPYQNKVEPGGGKTDISRWMSPLKIFEYMSTGKPIVSSNLPVLKEILDNETNAIMVDPKDIEQWEKAIKMLSDENIRSRLGNSAKKKFEANYTWEKRAELVLAKLKDV